MVRCALDCRSILRSKLRLAQCLPGNQCARTEPAQALMFLQMGYFLKYTFNIASLTVPYYPTDRPISFLAQSRPVEITLMRFIKQSGNATERELLVLLRH